MYKLIACICSMLLNASLYPLHKSLDNTLKENKHEAETALSQAVPIASLKKIVMEYYTDPADYRIAYAFRQQYKYPDRIFSFALQPIYHYFAVGVKDTVYIHDFAPGKPVIALTTPEATSISTIVAESSNRFIMTIANSDNLESNTTKLWHRDGKLITTLPSLRHMLSPQGTYFAQLQDDNSVLVTKTPELEPVATLVGHTQPITGTFFTHDEQTIVTGSLDATLRIWDARTGKSLKVIPTELPIQEVLSIDTQGKHALIAGLTDAEVSLYVINLKTGTSFSIPHGRNNMYKTATLSPDGTYVVYNTKKHIVIHHLEASNLQENKKTDAETKSAQSAHKTHAQDIILKGEHTEQSFLIAISEDSQRIMIIAMNHIVSMNPIVSIVNRSGTLLSSDKSIKYISAGAISNTATIVGTDEGVIQLSVEEDTQARKELASLSLPQLNFIEKLKKPEVQKAPISLNSTEEHLFSSLPEAIKINLRNNLNLGKN